MPADPAPPLTFLFTDIEGSTRLWEQHPVAMRAALAQHDDLLRACIESHGGAVFKTVGDAFHAAFSDAPAALRAALAAQQWLPPVRVGDDDQGSIRVRMALHHGTAEFRDGDYFGPALNRVARLLVAGYGGQILLSAAARTAIGELLPEDSLVRDRGSHRLKDLQEPEQIYQVIHPDLPNHRLPLRTASTHPNNLPSQNSSFVGREAVLAELHRLLGSTRLLCLTGSGGCGKSRLALQLATQRLEQFPDGVWLVELAPVADPALVQHAVCGVFGLREERSQSRLEQLAAYLQQRQLLLVLDNCEHVLDEAAAFSESVLKQCPGVSLLVTSREALRVPGETSYAVPSMAVPAPSSTEDPLTLLGYEGTRLFVDRAAAVVPGFTATPENCPAIVSVCRRLDGIPLAIELAAARIRTLSPSDIDRRLDQRFRLLTGGSRTALPRQQTLRALIDWSYDLLAGPERLLMQRLSVFAGGWTLESAEEVCGDVPGGADDLVPEDVLDVLTRLVEKSLVVFDGSGSSPRYRLLETVRQYARDRLFETGQGEVWRHRHRDHFLALAEEAATHFKRPGQVEWFRRLDREQDNLNAALEWTAAEPESLERGYRFCIALQPYWWARGLVAEGFRWCQTFLTVPQGEVAPLLRAGTLHCSGALQFLLGRYESATEALQQALAIERSLGDRKGISTSLSMLGTVATWSSRYEEAEAFLDESLQICRESGDRTAIASTLLRRCALENFRLNNCEGLACAREALEICRELGDLVGIANALANMGALEDRMGDWEQSRAHHLEALAIDRELGEKRSVGRTLSNLGLSVRRENDFAGAQSYLEQSLAIRREIGDRWGVATTLCNLSAVLRDQGFTAEALPFCEESLGIYRQLGDRRGLAFALQERAEISLQQDDRHGFRQRAAEALAAGSEIGETHVIIGMLRLLARTEQSTNPAAAARLIGAADGLGGEVEKNLAPKDRALNEQVATSVRSTLGDEAYEAAWTAGSQLTLCEAVTLALATGAPLPVPKQASD